MISPSLKRENTTRKAEGSAEVILNSAIVIDPSGQSPLRHAEGEQRTLSRTDICPPVSETSIPSTGTTIPRHACRGVLPPPSMLGTTHHHSFSLHSHNLCFRRGSALPKRRNPTSSLFLQLCLLQLCFLSKIDETLLHSKPNDCHLLKVAALFPVPVFHNVENSPP